MRQVYMFLDWGDGWRSVNGHTGDVAALDGFGIQWGTDDMETQPDPSVLSFRLIDRDGWLTANATRLAGAKVCVRMAGEPTWRDTQRMDAATWAQLTGSVRDLHRIVPASPPNAVGADDATTLFVGIVATGGEATPRRDGGWLLELSASSRMILWKRLAKQGPTSSDARLAELHWVGSLSTRLAELNRRAQQVGAPQADTTGFYVDEATPAPYKTDNYPDQLSILHASYSHAVARPLWYEIPDGDHSRLGGMPMGDSYFLSADTAGHLAAYHMSGDPVPGVPARLVIIEDDGKLTIPEPVTQFVIKGKKAAVDNDGKLQFDESELTVDASAELPDNLADTQSSYTFDSDMVTVDETGGAWKAVGGTTFALGSDGLFIRWLIQALDERLRPGTVVFDSRKLDPAEYARLYVTACTAPLVFEGMSSRDLIVADGRPATGGVWAPLGGTLTYEWINGTPVLRNEVNLWPLCAPPGLTRRWSNMDGWPVTWAQCDMTLAEFTLILNYQTDTEQEGTQQ